MINGLHIRDVATRFAATVVRYAQTSLSKGNNKGCRITRKDLSRTSYPNVIERLRRMFIALIMAGDGEIDMCVGPFKTQEEADRVGAELYSAFDPTFDRLSVVGVDDLATARHDVQEMREAAEQDE